MRQCACDELLIILRDIKELETVLTGFESQEKYQNQAGQDQLLACAQGLFELIKAIQLSMTDPKEQLEDLKDAWVFLPCAEEPRVMLWRTQLENVRNQIRSG